MQKALPATLCSGCKLNLYLNITGLRADGYHELETFMVPLSTPFDTLKITPNNRDASIALSCAAQGIDPQNNTVTKAYELYREASGFAPGITVELVKGVPHGAGLGGGSANAAALLLYLNAQSAGAGYHPLETVALQDIAAKIGADVPFFIENKSAWARGIGELLTPAVNPYAEYTVVLICPDISVNTVWAYKEFDNFTNFSSSSLTTTKLSDTNTFSGDFRLYNSFEDVVFNTYPQLGELKKHLLNLGADQALMSGSGSSIFGLFTNIHIAEKAYCSLKNNGLTSYLIKSNHAGVSPSW